MKTFYCYSRCSTCHKAQKWLDNHHISYYSQDLVKQPPTKAQFITWLTLHQDKGLKYFFNTHGQHYREQQLKAQLPTMTLPQAASLLASDGKLIKRPLLVEGNQLTCGFNEKTYQEEWL